MSGGSMTTTGRGGEHPSCREVLVGKLADAELHFTEGVLNGLKLIGFGAPRRR